MEELDFTVEFYASGSLSRARAVFSKLQSNLTGVVESASLGYGDCEIDLQTGDISCEYTVYIQGQVDSNAPEIGRGLTDSANWLRCKQACAEVREKGAEVFSANYNALGVAVDFSQGLDND